MPASVFHQLTATTPDDPLYEIKPSDFNNSHLVTLNIAATEISQIFSNANGVSFGLDGTNITATVKTDYLTTAMASNRGSDFVQANAAFAGTNNTGTIASNGISVSGLNQAVSFTSGSVAFQTLSFTNSNGISFNSGTQGIFGSHNALTSQSNQAFSAPGGSSAFQTLVFANSQGVSWSNSNGSVVGSVQTDYRRGTDAVGLNTAQSNVTWTVNSAGISLDARGYAGTATTFNGANLSGSMTVNSNGVQLSMSANAPAAGVGIAAGTRTATTAGNLLFDTGNGVTFGLNAVGGSVMTASVNTSYRASNDAIGLNTANSNVTWTANSAGLSLDARGYAGTGTSESGAAAFTLNSNGLAFNANSLAGVGTSATNASITLDSNGLAISVAAPGGGGMGFAAGTQTATSGTVVFSNSNNITFGMSDSSIITASFNPINIGMSTNGNTAGTTGTFDGANLQYVLVGGNNITLSQSSNANSVTLSIHGAAAGGGMTNSCYYPPQFLAAVWNTATVANGSVFVVPMNVDAAFQFDNFGIPINYLNTSNSSGSVTISFFAGLYTRNGSSLSRMHSSSSAYAITNSGTVGIYSSIGGIRLLNMGWTSTVTQGCYWLGVGLSTATAGANCSISSFAASQQGSNVDGYFSLSTAVFRGVNMLGQGRWTGATASAPSSMAMSDIQATASGQRRPPIFVFQSQTF